MSNKYKLINSLAGALKFAKQQENTQQLFDELNQIKDMAQLENYLEQGTNQHVH